jgi:hypothetical protein
MDKMVWLMVKRLRVRQLAMATGFYIVYLMLPALVILASSLRRTLLIIFNGATSSHPE